MCPAKGRSARAFTRARSTALLAGECPLLLVTPAAFPSVASVQVVSVFSSFGFQWPVQLTKLFAASSMSTFNEQLMAPECSIGAWSFELKYVRAVLCVAGVRARCDMHCTWCAVRRWYMMQAVPLVFIGGLVGFAVADKARVCNWWSAHFVYVERDCPWCERICFLLS
jgi:hypothetical protein